MNGLWGQGGKWGDLWEAAARGDDGGLQVTAGRGCLCSRASPGREKELASSISDPVGLMLRVYITHLPVHLKLLFCVKNRSFACV